MAEDFGTGVSRTLSAFWRQFGAVVWQRGKPPLDSELNLMAQIDGERLAQLVRANTPSGFLMDPTRGLNDYRFDQLWSNLFVLGNPRVDNSNHTYDSDEKNPVVWVNVNGWVLPVAGTHTDDVENRIKLYPPPASESRVDFVFLEAWSTLVAPNPSIVNKPDQSHIWKYGNVQYGGTNITDDLEDPEVRFETSERVQVQYRLRVFGQGVGLGAGVALDVYPDGLDDPNILGQGTASSPVGGFQFTNMREELGDPSLWRAGDGDPDNALGTVDGYVYAIPVCAVFRRNSGVYQSVADSGTANQNGAFLRTPTTQTLPDPLTGARALLSATLGTSLAYDDENLDVSVTNLNGSGLEDLSLNLGSTFLVIDGEIIGIDSINVPAGTVHIPLGGRGRNATNAAGHSVGSVVEFYNNRPDGLFADEIAPNDILDLRRAINPGDWDFQRLLENNIAALTRGDLRTSWKQSGTGTTEGVTVHEVDYLQADGSVATPNGTEALDGPDGIRQVWSDAAVQQPDVTLLLDNDASLIDNGIGFASADQFDTTVQWQTGPDFLPTGYMNLGGVFSAQSWTNGSSVFLHIGGEDGTRGARGTFRDGADREVRFVTPKEYFKAPSPDVKKGNQYPITLRFLEETALEALPPQALSPETYPGPMYPWDGRNFERPFIVLGQVVNTSLKVTVDPSTFSPHTVPITGTLDTTAGDSLVTSGAGDTLFSEELKVGDYIFLDSTGPYMVRSITDDSNLDLAVNVPVTVSGSGHKLIGYTIDTGVDFDASGVWYKHSDPATKTFANDPRALSNPLLNGRRTLYGMLTAEGADRTGNSSELYAVTYGDKDSLGNNGAWKIRGAGSSLTQYTFATSGSTSLVLYPLSADFTGVDTATGNSLTLEVRSMEHLAEVGGSYQDGSPDLCVVLTDIGGDDSGSPWDRENLKYKDTDPNLDKSMPRDAAVNDKVAIPSKLLLSTSLLYHPGRGGMARVPDDVVRVSLRDANSSYLRKNKAAIDATFPNIPSDETVYDTAHVQLWNRLPALGWNAPFAPSYGGNIVGFTEQDREHELFLDKGSKTLVYRPFRDRAMTLQALTIKEYTTSDYSLLGDSYTYPDSHPKDNLQLFTRTGTDPSTGKRMGFAVPREYMPRFGRQDIPFYVDTASGTSTFLNGINHLFRDATDLTNPVFNIIGGQDNGSGGNQVTPMFFRTSVPTSYGHGISGGNITPTVSASFLEARKTTSIDTAQPYAQDIVNRLRSVNSSDLGKGLKGIQLPPYYGIARLYGVYDARDYETKGGQTFQADRITLETDPVPNLLRTDADQQTLFILQDGAKDKTTKDGDHTYIIPFEALDITKALNYNPGDKFEDYDYIVEATVFGFANGFINENNYVLVRARNGAGGGAAGGAFNVDGDDPQLEGVHLVIPSAAAYNDALFVAHNRTVYQGDPYMTRHQSTRVTSDYEFRYGRPDPLKLHELATPIQQYLSTGEPVPTTPNARAFEVLAALDFYTTLGTGNVGGGLLPGTFMDVGFMEPAASTRIPEYLDSPPWRVGTRAFTQGQKSNSSRAEAIVRITNNDNLDLVGTPSPDKHATVSVTKLDGSVVTLGFSRADHRTDPSMSGLSDASIIPIDEESQTSTVVYEKNTNFTGGSGTVTFGPGETHTVHATSVLGINAEFGDTILVYPKNQDPVLFVNPHQKGALVFDGWVQDNGGGNPEVVLRAVNTVAWQDFESEDGEISYASKSYAGVTLTPNTSTDINIPVTGAQVGDTVAWSFADEGDQYSKVTPDAPLVIVPGVNTNGNVRITITNPVDSTQSGVWPSGTFRVAVFHESSTGTYWDINLDEQTFYIRVIHSQGDLSKTLDNLVTTVNAHPHLQTSVTAYKTSSEEVVFQAEAPGEEGNTLRVGVKDINDNVLGLNDIYVRSPSGLRHQRLASINFSGGHDEAVNGGDGATQLRLSGMTERLPLGILLQDSDFLGENPLGDTATAMKTSPAGLRPLQTILPLTTGGEEFTRFLGAPGDIVGMADGSVLEYTPFNETAAPTGAKTLRIYRGGGSAFVLSGLNPGGPVDWVSETFSAPLRPVLKGAALVCRAMLVRNFYEEPFDTPFTVSQGDEIQMLVITHGVLGNGHTQAEGVELSGIISPSGYGEGLAAADRYRISGRPMFKGFSRVTPDPENVILAPVPDMGG